MDDDDEEDEEDEDVDGMWGMMIIADEGIRVTWGWVVVIASEGPSSSSSSSPVVSIGICCLVMGSN